MKKIPAGSIMHIHASYDNTVNNPYNPNIPPQTVTWGEGTSDEMYLVGMTYVPYMDGDENIVIGEDVISSNYEPYIKTKNQLLNPFPNPGNGLISVGYFLDEVQDLKIELINCECKIVQTILDEENHRSGEHLIQFKAKQLQTGIYNIRMHNYDMSLSRAFIVSEN